MTAWAGAIGGLVPKDHADIRSRAAAWLEQTGGPLKLPLLPVQQKSVANALGLRYSCLWDDMGLGKTAQALAVDALGGHKNTLILCPQQVKNVWRAEIAKFTGIPQRMIYEGSGSEFSTLFHRVARKYRYLIFNYEAVRVAGETPDILPGPWEACTHHILDECHKMRSPHTKLSHSYRHFLRKHQPHAVTMLSGTPVDRCAEELWSWFNILSYNPNNPPTAHDFRGYFPNSTVFAERYAHLRESTGSLTFRGHKPETVPELKMMMGPKWMRREIREVTSLPRLTGHRVAVNESAIGLDEDDVRATFGKAFALSSTAQNKLEGETPLNAKGDAFLRMVQAMRLKIAMAKVPFTAEWVEKSRRHFPRVLVFSEFCDPLIAMREALKRSDTMLCAAKLGSKQEMDRNVSRFRKSGGILLATYGALSEGVNLQECNVTALNDLPWQPLVVKQAVRRTWRIGQEQECHVGTSLCNADGVVLGIVQKKEAMVSDLEKVWSELKNEHGLV